MALTPDPNIKDQNLDFNTAYTSVFKNGRTDSAGVGDYQFNQPGQFRALPETEVNGQITGQSLVASVVSPLNPQLDQGVNGFSGNKSMSRGSNSTASNPNTGSRPPLQFPAELGHERHKWPMIKFATRINTPAPRYIFLPVPSGIAFSDGMQYNTIDLGIMGTMAAEAATAGFQAQKAAGGGYKKATAAAIGAFAGSASRVMKNLETSQALSIAARQIRMDNVANAIDFSQRQVIVPNTNTSFQNVGLRSFAFSFKMMPRSRQEAETITAIIKTFRENMYPEGTEVVLKYPPIWTISFYDGEGRENKKLPRIYTLYLTGMSATYNASSHMFHEDGNPTETDVSLQFQETKTLTLKDITALSEQ